MDAGVAARVEVWQGDVTTLRVDAIVNAANAALSGGGGVDGAIHAAAGPGLLAECRGLGRCPPGEARITGGHALPARHVIHAVGPVWYGGERGEAELLRGAYVHSLELARAHALRTVAFPALSTGAYGYPLTAACEIAVDAVAGFLATSSLPERIILCTFGPAATAAMRAPLSRR